MEKQLNWGLLSTARINRALIPPINASKRNHLLAVASRSRSTADAYAREWKIPRAHGSYEDLLNDPQVDVIYNPLPNHMHAEWSIKAMRAGKHVLCEKPFALTLEEVDAMIAASKETGKVLAEAFMYRHHPQTLKAKEIVESGKLGKILVIKGEFSFKLDNPEDYRHFKEMGGGSIWDVGCYPISYARLIAGEEPVEVFGWQVLGAGGSDEVFAGQMRFANGILSQFDSSFVSPYRVCMEIVGSEATLIIPKPFNPGPKTEIFIRRGDEQESVKVKGEALYIGEVEDMADAILLGKPSRMSLQDTRGNIAAILALLESAEKGGPVLSDKVSK
jgi:xylose dehydrogenase (NAD/NADP)